MKTISIRIVLRVALVLVTLSPPAFAATTYVQPYSGRFAPTGTTTEPWPNLTSGMKHSATGVVEILGTTPIYGSLRLADPTKLTRNSASGPIKIGAAPISQTSFRCVSYNARLSGGGHSPGGWADAERAAAIRDYNWGSPDFIGFCEIWNSDPMYTTYLAAMPGYVDDFTGFELWGSFQHSGVCMRSKNALMNKLRVEFTDCAGDFEDCQASKSFLRARMVKDGIGIWVYMTHTQADAGFPATWYNIYDARTNQCIQIRDDINTLRATYVSDVFFVMGDFNVFGDYRGPTGSPNQSEYGMLRAKLGSEIVGGEGMDLMAQFYPRNYEHTFSHSNPLLQYFYPGTTEADSARLDYIIAINSYDGKVVVEPTQYEVIKAMAPSPITASGETFSDLSDHYAIAGDFRIFRTSN